MAAQKVTSGTHRTRGWTVPVSTITINISISNPEPITRFPEISNRVGSHLDKAAPHNKTLTKLTQPCSTSVGEVIFPNSFILCNLWWMSSKNFKQMGETFQKENEGSLRYFWQICSSFIRAQIYKANKLSHNSHWITWGIKKNKERVNIEWYFPGIHPCPENYHRKTRNFLVKS